ncbi:hypothetical protein LJR289_005131 [Pseudoduganella sp. LjRoot289]|uniref:hypothetical protein n=1 Tax=Pseudoduganella sp. LjRoot289 TaxID=3342314 RepID=UPI003ECCF5A5
MATLQISLPDDLASAAYELGLLEPKTISEILRKEVRRLRVNELDRAMRLMSADDGDAMSPEDVEEEIRQVRLAHHDAVGT